ncbi:aldose epimerase [Pedobacter ginsenosidimutans]|uniref:Aldose 1-epimerase n=1 Tax=Pedobacter ginsenosidimutans TaxID=687842 RepID=A0A0T5VPX9_9SPHI|nr:aldose epimerase family protein [Pedobacter ginsenosidimutans]KRT15922.1 aldose epimerase [Pedobacter ginsenosidimutans]
MKIKSSLPILLLILAAGCKPTKTTLPGQIPSAENFQQEIDGKHTDLFILKNKQGMKAAITNYGGRLVSLLVPNAKGDTVDVVVGFNDLDGYKDSSEPYFGATIGRYGNRIAKGKFSIDGKAYQIIPNNGPNALHGGKQGFQYRVWDAKRIGDSVLVLKYTSKAGEEGFPGKLNAMVTYTLTHDNHLELEYSASTDEPTIVNLTNHAFFNLNGAGSILSHNLMINANGYTPVGSTLIPTGALASVKGTPFDFRISEKIGSRINADNQQLKFGKGYDHNYVLNPSKMMPAAVVTGDLSGITMEVYTTEPGLQFYSGNFMQSKNKLRTGLDDFRTAFCLETQHFPDSPNHPNFPNTVLRPGQVYKSTSIYTFSAAK